MHEHVVIRRGVRSGLPIVVAVHSTALGQAIGGCRVAQYPHWRDGLSDALRLSAAMSDRCALAGLPNGGGKTVVALPPGRALDAAARRAVLHDAGDAIGAYATGPDVGTGPDDMVTIAERAPHAFCRPVHAGGSGDSSGHRRRRPRRAACPVRRAIRVSRSVRAQHRRARPRPRRRARTAHARRRRRDPGGRRHRRGQTNARRHRGCRLDQPAGLPCRRRGRPRPCRPRRSAHPAHSADTALRRDRRTGQQPTRQPGHRRFAAPARHPLGTGHHRQRRRHHPRHCRRATRETSAQATARVHGIADTLTDILRTARATGSTPAAAARARARHRMESGRR
ncbi:hypothetical protein KBX39_00235 [Micromonospora sp. D75]|nr:hypothetical protein [Micromonospora sp. D75]